MFFPRETFGRDALVAGDAPRMNADETTRTAQQRQAAARSSSRTFPFRRRARRSISLSIQPSAIRWPAAPASEKLALLKRTSYRDYLTKICGCSEEVAEFCKAARSASSGSAPMRCRRRMCAISAIRALRDWVSAARMPAWSEPYIYHFPDGNASLARLLVRSLVPGIAPGSTMDDVVQAPFDYGKLDDLGQQVRIRLDSTCLDVRNAGDEVQVGYVRDGTLRRVAGKHVVLACFHTVIPHIMPELPEQQRAALAKNVKTPIVYTNVIVRNWRAFVNLKVSGIAAPMSFHHQVSLDFPVSMGGYAHTRDLDQPICLHLVHVPGAPNQGLDARIQFRIGQGKLLAMTLRGFRGAHSRRPRSHAGSRRLFQRARHRGDHGEPLAARLQLCAEFAVRSPRITKRPCSGWRDAVRPGGYREHGFRRRRLGAFRDRPGGAGGGGTGGLMRAT